MAYSYDRRTATSLDERVDAIYRELASAPPGYERVQLGEVQGDPILLFRPLAVDPSWPRALVVAGCHGDEPAGVYAVLRALQQPDILGPAQLSFIPLVNPTGLRRGQRWNWLGEDPNRGYVHTEWTPAKGPSAEGTVLMAHRDLLLGLSADAFLTLHEDHSADGFFIHTFCNRRVPITDEMRQIASRDLGFEPADLIERYGGIVRYGLIFNSCHGSLEDYLWHAGVPVTLCGETPGRGEFPKRVACGEQWIRALASFVSRGRTAARRKKLPRSVLISATVQFKYNGELVVAKVERTHWLGGDQMSYIWRTTDGQQVETVGLPDDLVVLDKGR